ncbi:hypothetical protein [Paeniglutamicibacter sulfureus]|uniref:DUF2516 family protein n=1 Tax=Paeniglutamicibacter sulfureus TaxID=43666 RepID=A0ABU2BD47_9MICC|nr:hypothetical protein [Paeniglutamicibacter sulfureus]MDR7356543.1 hypothetical protein [Paeniglutamicibacter sulfureus]
MQIAISIALVAVSIAVAHLLITSSSRQDAKSPRVKWTYVGLFIAFCVLLGVSDQFGSPVLDAVFLVALPALGTVLWHAVAARKPRRG